MVRGSRALLHATAAGEGPVSRGASRGDEQATRDVTRCGNGEAVQSSAVTDKHRLPGRTALRDEKVTENTRAPRRFSALYRTAAVWTAVPQVTRANEKWQTHDVIFDEDRR